MKRFLFCKSFSPVRSDLAEGISSDFTRLPSGGTAFLTLARPLTRTCKHTARCKLSGVNKSQAQKVTRLSEFSTRLFFRSRVAAK